MNPRSRNRLAKQKNCTKANNQEKYEQETASVWFKILQRKYISTSTQLSGEKDSYNTTKQKIDVNYTLTP